jgi:uncharacterized HAD superfamily protein
MEKENRLPEEFPRISPGEVAFDIDGVFADTFRLFVDRAKGDYGYGFRYEDITEYDFASVIHIDERASDTIVQALVDFPLESGIQPIAGAVEVLTRLSQAGPLLFVTARPNRAPIMAWIRHHLPQVDPNRIDLEATQTHQKKPDILRDKGVRYFVEDRLETCFLLQEHAIAPIVFEQPWNRKPHPFPVVKTWNDIAALISW